MATVSAKMLSPSGSNLSASKTIDTEKRTRLTVTRNSNPWIYSNYPEAIGKNGKGLALAENGYFLNQQTISGTAEVFYSHTNYTGKRLYVGIQAYNSSSKSVTVTCQNYGDSSGWNKSINAVKNFFSSKKTSVTIASGKAAWIATSQAIPADPSTPFTGMCRFETSGSVVVTVYAYQSTSAVDGNAVAFPYGLSYSADKSINHTYPAVYSGKGTGYYLTFTHGTKYVSDLLSRPYIYTSNAQGGYGNSNEMIPIKMIQGGLTADPNSSNDDLNNLGNWCAHNYNTITFKNNTSKTYTIHGYVGSAGTCQVMNLGGNVQAANLLDGLKTWRWCEITLAPNDTCSFDWQHIVASYGVGASSHEWSVD